MGILKSRRLMKTKYLISLFVVGAFSILGGKTVFSKDAEVQKVDLAKNQGFMGDPAQKRGFELGYDDGVRAGKKDQKEGKKQNPTGNENYKTANKKYRYEYGSANRFVSGYQAGFNKGYKSGYTRAEEITKGKSGAAKEVKPVKKRTPSPAPKKVDEDSESND